MKISDIFDNIKIIYNETELTNLKTLSLFSHCANNVFDSEEKHIASVFLHTGSFLYNVILITTAAIACLIDNNTDIETLLNSLTKGQLLILNGKRVEFVEINLGKNIGINMPEFMEEYYMCYNENDGVSQTPIKRLSSKNISLYQGTAKTLDGRGIRSNLKERKDFLAYVLNKKTSEISTEISNSVSIVCDREQAEYIYENTKIKYDERIVKLSDLVTASFYSDNDSVQLGRNPTKEEPIIKFYSKISACRDDIKSDKKHRILGCILCDERSWVDSTETHDISDRRGLKYCILSGRVHYTHYLEWFKEDEYCYYSLIPEFINDYDDLDNNDEITNTYCNEIEKFLSRTIENKIVDSCVEFEELLEVKRKLSYLKDELQNDEDKEDFLTNSYSLINIFRTAFFPLSYYDKLSEEGIIPSETTDVKFQKMNKIKEKYIGTTQKYICEIITTLDKIKQSIYCENPKANIIKNIILNNEKACIVTTKVYYEKIFLEWLKNEIDGEIDKKIEILTASRLSSAKNPIEYVILPTTFYDIDFNIFAEFGFEKATILAYNYEKYNLNYMQKKSLAGKKIILEKCGYETQDIDKVEILDDSKINEEVSYEKEFKKLMDDWQLKRAYKDISNNAQSDGAKIKAIICFVSGAVGYFTEYYKAYRLSDDSLTEVELENLKVGDSILFTKESENKDIVDLFLNKLIETKNGGKELEDMYQLSKVWKEGIKQYIEDNSLTYQKFADLLEEKGCKKHQVTVRSWMSEESHVVGPRNEDDYKAIVETIGLELDYHEIKIACDRIRQVRTKILTMLGRAIIRNIIPSEKDDPIWNEISNRAEQLSQIEQISDINWINSEQKMSINIINRPL